MKVQKDPSHCNPMWIMNDPSWWTELILDQYSQSEMLKTFGCTQAN